MKNHLFYFLLSVNLLNFSCSESKTSKNENEEILVDEDETFVEKQESKQEIQSKTDFEVHIDSLFFSKHHFLHNQIEHKGGLIINDDTDNYEEILPKGLPIYQYNLETESVTLLGEVLKGNELDIETDEPIHVRNFGFKLITEIDYEQLACGFKEIVNDEYVLLPTQDEGFDVVFKILDLEKYGYHLEGDGYWLKKHSGSVMGYFPAYYEFVNEDNSTDYRHPIVTIFSEAHHNSEVLLSIEYDKQNGYFQVDDVEFKNGVYWAKIVFDYYTEEPCSGETFEDQPTVEGWIELYENMESRKVVLGFYSRGC